MKQKLIDLLGEEKFYLNPLANELNQRPEETIKILIEMSKYFVLRTMDPWKKALEAFRTQRKVYKKSLKAKEND